LTNFSMLWFLEVVATERLVKDVRVEFDISRRRIADPKTQKGRQIPSSLSS